LALDGGEKSGLNCGCFKLGKKAGDYCVRSCESTRDGLEDFEIVFALLDDAISVRVIHRVIRWSDTVKGSGCGRKRTVLILIYVYSEGAKKNVKSLFDSSVFVLWCHFLWKVKFYQNGPTPSLL